MAIYYLGRLDAQKPKVDLEALLIDQANRMTPADLKSEAVRCGSELAARGQELQDIGQRHYRETKGRMTRDGP